MKCCFCPFPISKILASNAPPGEEEDDAAVTSTNFRVFSYDELRAATRGFANKIGEGGFGSVYKGRLEGGDLIAVKVISVESESLRGEREFMSEIAALYDMKHQNLVALRGCSVNGAQRLLVYDFMENNSLTHIFFGGVQKRMKFTWTMRKRISLGIARGLCYIHEQVSPHVVHRDIKASNILLDRNFIPKIADFGLAKLFGDNVSCIRTRVAGTIGYLSPEYAYSGRLTIKSDVYSFGVLLLEIVSGQRAVDYHLKYGDQFLIQKAWELYNAGNLVELVDCALKGSDFSSEEAIQFLKVGLLCVQETAELRPKMCAALKMLANEIDVQSFGISQPGFVSDLNKVKIRHKNSSVFSSCPENSSTASFRSRRPSVDRVH